MNETPILTGEGLAILAEEVRKYIQDRIIEARDSVLEYDSSLLFPTIGKQNTIYIDKTKNISYRWDENKLKYYRLDYDNYQNIRIIDGSWDDIVVIDDVFTDELGNILTDESGKYLTFEEE